MRIINLAPAVCFLAFTISTAAAAGWRPERVKVQAEEAKQAEMLPSKYEQDLGDEMGGGSEKVASAAFSPCMNGTPNNLKFDFNDVRKLKTAKGGQRMNFVASGEKSVCGLAMAGRGRKAALGRIDIQFQGGDEGTRRAILVEDPSNPNNKVLQFVLKQPNVTANGRHPPKGRVQMNVYGNSGVKQVAMKVKMFLHEDLNMVKSYPGRIDWLTISEWWNNAGWTNEKYPFRISVNIVKEGVGNNSPLLFQVHAQTLDKSVGKWSGGVWDKVNHAFIVPVGKWIDLEYGFVEGDSASGRFFMAATVNGGARSVIFDVVNFTHHPSDPAPDGLTDFNPVKLYTSDKLVNYVRNNGGAMQIYWDDLDVTVCDGVGVGVDSACQF